MKRERGAQGVWKKSRETPRLAACKSYGLNDLPVILRFVRGKSVNRRPSVGNKPFVVFVALCEEAESK